MKLFQINDQLISELLQLPPELLRPEFKKTLTNAIPFPTLYFCQIIILNMAKKPPRRQSYREAFFSLPESGFDGSCANKCQSGAFNQLWRLITGDPPNQSDDSAFTDRHRKDSECRRICPGFD